MNDTIYAQILKRLKQQKGSSLDQFSDLIPQLFAFTDVPGPLYSEKPLSDLVSWGLVEAYQGSELVPAEQIARVIRSSRSFVPGEPPTFYISPLAVMIEEELGISLTATPVFGRPVSRAGSPQIFVLMPFAPKYRPIYVDHISVACHNLGLSVGRADDFFSTGSIMADVWSAIHSATMLIADCTERNPNVFYEIGIAHTLGKDTILIARSLDDIPFDLRHLRTIIYEYTPPGMTEFEKKLDSTLRELCKARGVKISGKPSKTKRTKST